MMEPAAQGRNSNKSSLLMWGSAAAAAMLAIACLLYRNSLLPSWRGRRMEAVEWLFVICASAVLIILYSDPSNRVRLRRILRLSGLIFLCAAFLFGVVYKLGMHQFGGFDESLIVHAATYYAQGFKPYVDFPCSFPPLFMAGIRFSMVVLGLRWAGFATIAAAFAALTCVWMFTILRHAAVPAHWALAITLCAEVSTMVLAPFWWFNNSTSISVVLLVFSVFACLRGGEALFPWISLAVSLAMVLTSKPNVEPACLMVFVLFATKSKARWARTSLACAGALVLAASICFVAQAPPIALLNSYAEVARLRGSPLLMFPFNLMDPIDRRFQVGIATLTALIFGYVLIRYAMQRSRLWPIVTASTIAAITSLEMTFTNAEIKTTDLVVMVAAVCCLCFSPWNNVKVGSRSKHALAGLLIIFFVTSGLFAATHLRILGIGPYQFYEPLPTQKIQSGFFAGLEAGPRLLRVEQQTARALALYPSRSVFFGPRMEFEYAVLNLPVMPNMPLIWDSGVTFSKERLPKMILSFQQQDPGLLIFLKDDYTRMGIMGDYIQSAPNYERIDSFPDLTVYVSKRQVPVADGGPR